MVCDLPYGEARLSVKIGGNQKYVPWNEVSVPSLAKILQPFWGFLSVNSPELFFGLGLGLGLLMIEK